MSKILICQKPGLAQDAFFIMDTAIKYTTAH